MQDLWDETHEAELNFVDPDSDSRVVISTRVRGLLKGAASIEVNVPSEQDAIRILMAAAEIHCYPFSFELILGLTNVEIFVFVSVIHFLIVR